MYKKKDTNTHGEVTSLRYHYHTMAIVAPTTPTPEMGIWRTIPPGHTEAY